MINGVTAHCLTPYQKYISDDISVGRFESSQMNMISFFVTKIIIILMFTRIKRLFKKNQKKFFIDRNY